MAYQLAQINVARLLAPLDSELLDGFVRSLDPVNASAEAAPGFVWRLKTEDGNATSIVAFEWDVGDAAGIGDGRGAAAFVLRAGDAVLRPDLHRHADDVVALLVNLQQLGNRFRRILQIAIHQNDGVPSSDR